MVKFGERLPRLMQRGWEFQYVNYDELKKILENGGPVMTEAFTRALERDIRKVDKFVASQLKLLREAFKAAKTTAAKRSVENDLDKLRRYVGTNIIAATKIVKKHDKAVAPAQQRRERVADLIMQCPALAAIPSFQIEVGGKAPPSPKSIAIDVVERAVVVEDDDEETEQGLRSLPTWLMSGSSKGQGSKDAKMKFINTYVADWTLEDQDLPLPLLGSNRQGGGANDSLHSSEAEGEGDDDVWGVDFSSDAKKWSELDGTEKVVFAVVVTLKLCLVVLALYAFICSLSFLADGFRLVAGRQAGEIFRNSEIFNNPIAGMLVGILVTVLVQSSSTSTSIVITMVAADLLTVRQAISLIMGANIGTSVTSTIVALSQAVDRGEFRRAFAAATVHDMFNFLNVLVLLPVEAVTGYLYNFSGALLPEALTSGDKPPDLLKALTKPFTKMIISLDKKVITKIAVADTPEALASLENARLLKHFFGIGPGGISDGVCGVIVLLGALAVLCVTLFTIVWTLKSILKGRIAVLLHKSVNGDIPDATLCGLTIPLKWLSGYVAMAVGVFVTILVQSSSITTSALTPLVGMGVLTVDRMYPTVLGANIGTCITGVLAALAADGSKLALTLRVAFSHLIFNITGIVVWYVIWPLRPVPIRAAKFLGNVTAEYKWFAIAYLFVCFFIIPGIFMGLSLASTTLTIVVIVVVVATGAFVAMVNFLQARKPELLPVKLRNWAWLPAWMTSLEPMDRVICGPIAKACFKGDKKTGKKAPRPPQPRQEEIEVAVQRLGKDKDPAEVVASV